MLSFVPCFQAFCLRCKSTVRVPDSLPVEALSEAVSLRQLGHSLQAVSVIVQRVGTELREAKCFVLHLTEQPGHCHRCQKALLPGVAECAVCHSINLDFAAPPIDLQESKMG